MCILKNIDFNAHIYLEENLSLKTALNFKRKFQFMFKCKNCFVEGMNSENIY